MSSVNTGHSRSLRVQQTTKNVPFDSKIVIGNQAYYKLTKQPIKNTAKEIPLPNYLQQPNDPIQFVNAPPDRYTYSMVAV